MTDRTQGLPPAERRVGEAVQTVQTAEQKWYAGRYCPRCGMELPHTHGEAKMCAERREQDATLEAQVARLTAEVERLTKEKAEAVAVAEEATAKLGLEGYSYTASGLRRRLTALSLPTPAPEAGTCPECNGPVYHRDGKPGEFDHECSAPPAPEATETECPDCEGNGFTLRSVNECCGHGTPSGECCGDPVEGQEQVACERCQATGKSAPPAPEATE